MKGKISNSILRDTYIGTSNIVGSKFEPGYWQPWQARGEHIIVVVAVLLSD